MKNKLTNPLGDSYEKVEWASLNETQKVHYFLNSLRMPDQNTFVERFKSLEQPEFTPEENADSDNFALEEE
jgi:hypothetical protein